MSVFSQVLQLFSRLDCEQAVKETSAERHARGFTCWGQFVAMRFCQLGRAKSLREICGGLATCEGKLSHLGITAPPVHPGVRECASALGPVQGGLRPVAHPLPGGRGGAPHVPVQAQTGQPGCLGDRPLRQPVRLGHVPPEKALLRSAPTKWRGLPHVLCSSRWHITPLCGPQNVTSSTDCQVVSHPPFLSGRSVDYNH